MCSCALIKSDWTSTTGWSWGHGQLQIRMLPPKFSSTQHCFLTSQPISFQGEQVNSSEVILGYSRASWFTIVLKVIILDLFLLSCICLYMQVWALFPFYFSPHVTSRWCFEVKYSASVVVPPMLFIKGWL